MIDSPPPPSSRQERADRGSVAWTQRADPTNRQDLLVNGYAEPSGWGRPTLLSSSAGLIDGPTMSANADGLAVTVWSSAEFVDASGNTLKSLASAQVDDRGNIFVAWLEPNELSGGQLLSDEAGSLGSSRAIAPET